jgi:hypothetical protein
MKPDKETQDNWIQDPNNWKWGLFYYNKEDKRIFPPKKKPALGVTVNFANKISVAILLTYIIITICVVGFCISK